MKKKKRNSLSQTMTKNAVVIIAGNAIMIGLGKMCIMSPPLDGC